MPLQSSRPQYVAAIVEQSNGQMLIALPSGSDQDRKWIFPRGLAASHESAEAAMRRVAREQLGITAELVIGQPPFLCNITGQMCEIRYFFCAIAGGQARPGPYAEIRWVSKAHLQEYDFDDPSKPVVSWLLGS